MTSVCDGSNDEASGALADKGRQSQNHLLICPACGASARRASARFCHTCGRRFAVDLTYVPTDALRASYHLQQSPSALRVKHKPFQRLPRSRAAHANSRAPRASSGNPLAALALASVAYALIPFLGILFCPGAITFGCWGVTRAGRLPNGDGHRAALFSICAGMLILVAQLLLWWMLSRVPQWATW